MKMFFDHLMTAIGTLVIIAFFAAMLYLPAFVVLSLLQFFGI